MTANISYAGSWAVTIGINIIKANSRLWGLRQIGVDMMRKDAKNIRLESLISLGVLAIGFVLIRYPLFKLHGMIQWPMTLAIICLAVIIVSIVLKAAITPLSTSASYIIGFFIAYIFQSDGTDPGGSRTNNLWIIWTVIIAVTAIVSSIYEFVRSRKTTR